MSASAASRSASRVEAFRDRVARLTGIFDVYVPVGLLASRAVIPVAAKARRRTARRPESRLRATERVDIFIAR